MPQKWIFTYGPSSTANVMNKPFVLMFRVVRSVYDLRDEAITLQVQCLALSRKKLQENYLHI